MWLTWRRYRVRLLLLATSLLALAIVMIVTENAYQSAVASCGHLSGQTGSSACSGVISGARSHASYVVMVLELLPFLIGLIFGAPLVASELGAQTNRLAWTQGVTRTRWLAFAWLTLAIPVVIMMALLAPIVQWWATNVNASTFVARGLIQNTQFEISGVAPVALTLFALSFATSMGALFRRIHWAVAAATVGLFAVFGFMTSVIVPRLAPQTVVPLTSAHFPRSLGLLIRSGYRWSPSRPGAAHAGSIQSIVLHCANSPGFGSSYDASINGVNLAGLRCLSRHHVQIINVYQPASHYWLLQWRAFGVYLALAAFFVGLSVWAVRRWRA